MKIGFFCRTYHKDAERLEYMLRSIERFAIGFSGVTIVCPENSIEQIRAVSNKFQFATTKACISKAPNDFIGQQISKMHAHLFTDDDLIVHIDSDCILTEEVAPERLLLDTKPKMPHAAYDYFYRGGWNCPWQSVTSRFLRHQVDYEFMRRFPLCYPRNLYIDLGNWFKEAHGSELVDIWKMIHGDQFSEFNLMGAFSFYSDPQYHVFTSPQDKSFVTQFCLVSQRENRAMTQEERGKIEEALR